MGSNGKRVEGSGDLILLRGRSREERLKNFIDSFTEEEKAEWDTDDEEDENGRHSMSFEEYVSHRLDMMESDGFDIQDYSKVADPGVLHQFYYPPEKPTDEECVQELKDCSYQAIAKFNSENSTRYGNVLLVKANTQVLCPYRYFITFKATNETNNQQETFQAKVNVCFPNLDKVVELVRIKTAPNPVYIARRR
ncbi:hypothetical protein DCAR_0626613 [Daucus carota subsp. sativus]|uniref:Cystatin domain-containing protein n=1 Tax=Daucus carota subsp. sativus TaxID=79200 RepID=A0AAF0XHN8_DAUCS|nr:PREDICTED: uncharacterized protein LOC108227784 [Daucus carota subsp. sativus]WOH07184.1 hypothetical protein DCAR_0626613 [Daucus carota subsp. sativus]